MNPEKFTWELHISKLCYAISEVWNWNTNRPFPRFKEFGRCPANRLPVKPKDRGEAVMLLDTETGDLFWLHALSDKDMGVT
jgi:hypothetical protein